MATETQVINSLDDIDLSHSTGGGTRVIAQQHGIDWSLYNCDCVEGIAGLPAESVGFSVFSPPFASLYTYSNSERDMGNCDSSDRFFQHFGFLVAELRRVIMPGRVVAIHCMDMPEFKAKHGHVGVDDFPGDIIRVMRSVGFIYDGRCTIWKDPVTAMQRTKSIRLLHKQICKDSSISGWALPDYLLKFKAPGNNPAPVEGEFDYFAGDSSTFKSNGRLSIDIWQRYASPVWMDINMNRTLQYMSARDEKDERHICPLQLDVIERCLQLWSNPGDIVLTPYAGIGSEVYMAVKLGRKGIGFELKPSYFAQAVKNIRRGEQEAAVGKIDFEAAELGGQAAEVECAELDGLEIDL